MNWVPVFPRGNNKLQEDWNTCKTKMSCVDHLMGPALMKNLGIKYNPLLTTAVAEMIAKLGYSLNELLTCEEDEIRSCAKFYKQMGERVED